MDGKVTFSATMISGDGEELLIAETEVGPGELPPRVWDYYLKKLLRLLRGRTQTLPLSI